MNADQTKLLKKIQKEKLKFKPDKSLLKKLVRKLTSYDDYYMDVKCGHGRDPGGRSRSPSFGQWDERTNLYE